MSALVYLFFAAATACADPDDNEGGENIPSRVALFGKNVVIDMLTSMRSWGTEEEGEVAASSAAAARGFVLLLLLTATVLIVVVTSAWHRNSDADGARAAAEQERLKVTKASLQLLQQQQQRQQPRRHHQRQQLQQQMQQREGLRRRDSHPPLGYRGRSVRDVVGRCTNACLSFYYKSFLLPDAQHGNGANSALQVASSLPINSLKAPGFNPWPMK
jgi:hypothetical protein